MRRPLLLIGFVAGCTAAAALAVYAGLPQVGRALAEIGWPGLAAVTLLQLVSLALCATAWRTVGEGAGWPAYLAARWIRDGVSNLWGFVPALGEAAAARTLAKAAGSPIAAMAASTIVDFGLEALAQVLFTVVGLLALAQLVAPAQALGWVLPAALSAVPVLAAFLVSRSPAALRRAERLARAAGRLLGLGSSGLEPVVAGHVRRLYARRARVAGATLIHLAAWLAGALQLWAASQWLDRPLTLPAAVVLESLVFAARSAVFLAPWGLGVQEGGFLLVGAALGVPASEAMALSLVLRARDVVVGAPSLLAWTWSESRRGPPPVGLASPES